MLNILIVVTNTNIIFIVIRTSVISKRVIKKLIIIYLKPWLSRLRLLQRLLVFLNNNNTRKLSKKEY